MSRKIVKVIFEHMHPGIRVEESALVRTLPPGSYTAIVRGMNSSTGVGLVETYNLQ